MNTKYQILKFETLTSTNDKAKELIQNDKISDFTVVLANEQTKGRGQRKNSWHVKAGKNLTFSIITKPIFLKANEQFYLSKAVSLGIITYLNTKKNKFEIKWPNDIYFNDKKICGILIENSLSGLIIKNSIIGIGININQISFPEFLRDAVSLSNTTNKKYNLDDELNLLLKSILSQFKILNARNFKLIDNLYHKFLYKKDLYSKYKDSSGIFAGKITGTLPEGQLIIETSDKEIRTYNFKEVEFLK